MYIIYIYISYVSHFFTVCRVPPTTAAKHPAPARKEMKNSWCQWMGEIPRKHGDSTNKHQDSINRNLRSPRHASQMLGSSVLGNAQSILPKSKWLLSNCFPRKNAWFFSKITKRCTQKGSQTWLVANLETLTSQVSTQVLILFQHSGRVDGGLGSSMPRGREAEFLDGNVDNRSGCLVLYVRTHVRTYLRMFAAHNVCMDTFILHRVLHAYIYIQWQIFMHTCVCVCTSVYVVYIVYLTYNTCVITYTYGCVCVCVNSYTCHIYIYICCVYIYITHTTYVTSMSIMIYIPESLLRRKSSGF